MECVKCVYGRLGRCGMGGEGDGWMRVLGLGLGFTNPVGTGECWSVMYVCVVSPDSLCRWQI